MLNGAQDKSDLGTELEALARLQGELVRQQRRIESLDTENASLREGLRGGSRQMDLRSGELAVGRVAMEELEREKHQLMTERDRLQRIVSQYNLEKSVLMDTLLDLGADVDEAQRRASEFFRRFMTERQIRKAQHRATSDFLASKGVSAEVLQVSELLSFLLFFSFSFLFSSPTHPALNVACFLPLSGSV